jgi:hypothetical protein
MLFLALTCVAGYFGGYKQGHEESKKAWDSGSSYSVIYRVTDLVPLDCKSLRSKAATIDELITLITTQTPPLARQASDSDMQIQPMPSGNEIVLAAGQDIHQWVAMYLEYLRASIENEKLESEMLTQQSRSG